MYLLWTMNGSSKGNLWYDIFDKVFCKTEFYNKGQWAVTSCGLMWPLTPLTPPLRLPLMFPISLFSWHWSKNMILNNLFVLCSKMAVFTCRLWTWIKLKYLYFWAALLCPRAPCYQLHLKTNITPADSILSKNDCFKPRGQPRGVDFQGFSCSLEWRFQKSEHPSKGNPLMSKDHNLYT